jgi:PAT family beta-lactamase induction signal transducer AmpG
MTMLGVFAGGFAVARFGLLRSLLVGAVMGPLSNLSFAWLATRGHDVLALAVAIGIDNSTGGFAATCLIAYMSSLTSAGFTATQYALLSSFYASPGRLIASQSGRIVAGAAAAAEAGGFMAGLKDLFSGLPPESFADALARSGVSPAALGAGYFVFFSYTALIGILPVVLAIAVFRRDRRRVEVPPSGH